MLQSPAVTDDEARRLLAELKSLMGKDLTEDFQEDVEAPDDLLLGLIKNGITDEWVASFAKTFRSVPASWWPKILRTPRLHRASGNRSMLGSKMELRNAEAKSKRVRIAASMTDQETVAKKALLAANVTPQQVADELGVGRSTVNAWCNGTRSIPKEHREALAKPTPTRKAIKPTVWKNQA